MSRDSRFSKPDITSMVKLIKYLEFVGERAENGKSEDMLAA